jgi:hypothetical protein
MTRLVLKAPKTDLFIHLFIYLFIYSNSRSLLAKLKFFFSMAETSLVDQGPLIMEALRSYSVRHTTLRYNLPGREIGPT